MTDTDRRKIDRQRLGAHKLKDLLTLRIVAMSPAQHSLFFFGYRFHRGAKLLVRIRDDVWKLYKKSWALFDIKGGEAAVRMLEEEIPGISLKILENGKRHLIDDCPEACVQREIGIREEQSKTVKTAKRKIDVTCLTKINTDENTSSLPYTEVIIDPAPSYCDCREKKYAEYGSFEVGPHYCPKHNVIIMENLFLPKNPEDVFQIIIQIISHETLHWLVGRIFGEPASFALYNSSVFDFIENW